MRASRALRYARRRAGLSQRELAARAGMAQAAVARIETGRVSPRVDTLSRLVDLCDCSLEVEPKRGIGLDGTVIQRLLKLSDSDRARAAAQAGQALAAIPGGRR